MMVDLAFGLNYAFNFLKNDEEQQIDIEEEKSDEES